MKLRSISTKLVLLLSVSLLTPDTFWSACESKEPAPETWREFRNGGRSEATGELPLAWSPTSGIGWQKELIGYGQSIPIIQAGRAYLTSVDGPMKDACVVTCLDLRSGETLWTERFDASQKAASNLMASRAAPTPLIDDQRLIAFFESGDCAAFDLAGKKLWHRDLVKDYGRFDNNHGLGTSPSQNAELVFINIEHRGPSYLLALDKATGQTRWKVDRPSSSSWSSPVVARREGIEHVIVSSAGKVDAYVANSGDLAWTMGGLDGNSVPSPTIIDNQIFVGARVPEFGGEGDASRSNLCITLGNSSQAQPQVAWRAAKAVSDYASPVVSGKFVYYINKIGVLYCLDRETGNMHYMERLGTQCWATPIVTGDKLFFFGKDGKTQIVRAGEKFDLLASNLLWNPDSPPKPESYVETSSSESGGGPNAGSGGGPRGPGGPGAAAGGAGGRRGSGMLESLAQRDNNGDGKLTEDELPADFRAMMARVDKNGDGAIDRDELKAMAESFAARRSDSREAARDPIVYGAAAAEGSILVRCGTRLYCISSPAKEPQ